MVCSSTRSVRDWVQAGCSPAGSGSGHLAALQATAPSALPCTRMRRRPLSTLALEPSLLDSPLFWHAMGCCQPMLAAQAVVKSAQQAGRQSREDLDLLWDRTLCKNTVSLTVRTAQPSGEQDMLALQCAIHTTSLLTVLQASAAGRGKAVGAAQLNLACSLAAASRPVSEAPHVSKTCTALQGHDQVH